jgi:RND family efflux transporter MFP subunit
VLTGYYNLQQQEINLSRYIIVSPFTGSFKSVNREIGAIASPGVELATIIRTDKLEVTVPVFPIDLKWINKGDKIQITNDDGVTKMATISRIADFVEEATQSVNVYLTYESKTKTELLQGEYVNVVFENASITGFEIPREALIDGSFVYELHNHKLEKTEVQILRQLNDSYIITGVDEGKFIVTESLASVNPVVDYFAR